jgi:hypothetical protein
MLNLSATYTGGGAELFSMVTSTAPITSFTRRVRTASPTTTVATARCRLRPSTATTRSTRVQSISGNVCFTIASNDADSLLLWMYVEAPDYKLQKVWFALH